MKEHYACSLLNINMPLKRRMEVFMSYVAPVIKEKFESLPIDLKNAILERDTNLNNIQDLIQVLEQIVGDGEQEDQGSQL